MRALALGSVIAMAACSPSVRTTVDTPDAAVTTSTSDAAPSLCYEPSVTGTVMAGSADLEDCAVWNNVANMTGTVTLTRDGSDGSDGSDASTLTMAFANGLTFTGTVDGSAVDLTYTALHDFSDGCTWRSTETLIGTLDPATCVLMVSYDYEEMVAISNGMCDTPCTGTADFSLEITPIF